ncbi:MAG: CgeB family protein [Myxococcota bacterium]
MKLHFVVCGLGMSSAWGSGHATLWRALCAALHRQGHRVTFYERDQPFYARYRDFTRVDYCDLVLYREWSDVAGRITRELDAADVGMVTSYCPDASVASESVLNSKAGLKVFYDLDTPVTLSCLEEQGSCAYIGANGLRDFELVLSFTGGRALSALQQRLAARQARPLYGSVDPLAHAPHADRCQQRAALSYLGTYARDRAASMDELFFEPARRCPEERFIVGGALYPESFRWEGNVEFWGHVGPAAHAEFFERARFTLNLTRRAMRDYGFCPSGRLFEAAACGAAMLSDDWEGLDTFFEPGRELLVVRSADDVLEALRLPEAEVARIASAARARVLANHTADSRARELVAYVLGYTRATAGPALANDATLGDRQGAIRSCGA